MKRLIALVAAFVLSLPPAAAGAVGGVEQTAESLDLHVTPAFASAGTTIALGGRAVADATHDGVHITITDPSSHATSLTANVGGDGSFASAYRDTKATGVYRVNALSPDGKAHADATFSIGGGGQLGESVARARRRTFPAAFGVNVCDQSRHA